MAIEYTTGKPVIHKHKGSDITDITSYIGQPLGVFTTAYPASPSVGRYEFAGTDGANVNGTVYNNGDSAFWDGSVWTRIPKQVINIEQVRSQSTNLAPSSKLMDDELKKLGSTYKGLAIPSTNPGIPDGPVFYLTSIPGTYSNFSGIDIKETDGVVILTYNGSSWIKSTLDVIQKTTFDSVITGKGVYSLQGYINPTGGFSPNADYRATDYLLIDKTNDVKVFGASAGPSSLILAFYDENKTFISGTANASSVTVPVANIPVNAKYIRCGTTVQTQNTATIINPVLLRLSKDLSDLSSDVGLLESKIPEVIDYNLSLAYSGYYYGPSGDFQPTTNAKNTGLIKIGGYNKLDYKVNISSVGWAVMFYNEFKQIIPEISIPGNGLTSGTINLSDPIYSNAKYIILSYYDAAGVYTNWEGKLYTENSLEERVFILENKNYSKIIPSVEDQLRVLIFGDSISDCANITVDGSDKTLSYLLRHPSNSYVNKYGQNISFDMWPYLLTQYFNCIDLRNYAKSGASYKYTTRSPGNERQNLSYQIELALNDIPNPNNVFPTSGNFSPDIVIFALGTNDGAPNDTFESAMSKTVMNSENTAFDIEATLANLDLTKFCEAARFAFLSIKNRFPYALCLCVLPIQRASSDIQSVGVNSELKKMAERYSIKVVDGASDMGIVRDLETNGGLGKSLKDGLHPNEKGQNLYSKLIINAIKNNWVSNVYMNL